MKQLPGFARHVLGRNMASTSRPTRGWVGWVFWGPGGLIRWVLGGKFPLFWSFGWIFFWRNMKRKETLPEKWLGQLFSGLARSMANCRIVLFLLLNAFGNLPTNACPGTQCTGDCLKAFASDLSFCHSKIYDYPRINIWLLKLHSTDTDLPGCYVATSTIPTATQEGSKFASRSMAWGVQFHRVRMVASTLKHSNSLPNKKPGKHLLHVEELRIHGLFMTYDSLLKQWWDSWERSLVHITVGETKTQKLNETQLGETHDISINRFHPI